MRTTGVGDGLDAGMWETFTCLVGSVVYEAGSWMTGGAGDMAAMR